MFLKNRDGLSNRRSNPVRVKFNTVYILLVNETDLD